MRIAPRFSTPLLALGALLCASTAMAQTALTPEQLKAKQTQIGQGLGLTYGVNTCQIAATPQQRADLTAKMASLANELGLSGEPTPDEVKEMLDLKTDQDAKDFCLGLRMKFSSMLADFLADRPIGGAAPADAAAAAPAAPAPAAPAAPAKTTVGDWTVEPVTSATGQCMVSREYIDKDDGNAENGVVIRGMSNTILVVLIYAKWNWTSGETATAALVTPDAILANKATWTADTTGKVISTQIPADTLDQLSKASKLIVKFPDGDAEFETPKISDALTAMAACAKGK